VNVRAARWALDVEGTTPTARHILVVLACHADHDGNAWPTVDTLVRETGWSRPTVVRALADLDRAGMVTRERRGRRMYYQFTACGQLPETVTDVYQSAGGNGKPQRGIGKPQRGIGKRALPNGFIDGTRDGVSRTRSPVDNGDGPTPNGAVATKLGCENCTSGWTYLADKVVTPCPTCRPENP
jgi:DNA-binding transcriptional ArsR family regulator